MLLQLINIVQNKNLDFENDTLDAYQEANNSEPEDQSGKCVFIH